MATSTIPQTELEAVNSMLEAVWESPVNSLESTGLSDVAIAKRVLSDTVREVLLRKWHFNTETDFPLQPDVNGRIPLPTNTLSVDTMPSEPLDVTPRGGYLYDKGNRTDIFTRSVKVEIVFNFEFSVLPETFKNYIVVRAARRFQEIVLEGEKGGFTEMDELLALSTLKAAEGDDGDHNILEDNYTVASILDRNCD